MYDNNEEVIEMLSDEPINEHLMKHILDLKISAISIEEMKSILGIILKALDSNNDYRVVKTPKFNLTYYKIGRIQ